MAETDFEFRQSSPVVPALSLRSPAQGKRSSLEHLHCRWHSTRIVSFNPSHLGGWFFFVRRRLLRPRAVRRPAPGPRHRSGSDIRMVLDPVKVRFCSSIRWLPGDSLSSDALSCTLLTIPCHSVLSPYPKPTSPSSAEQSTRIRAPADFPHSPSALTRRHNKSVRNPRTPGL